MAQHDFFPDSDARRFLTRDHMPKFQQISCIAFPRMVKHILPISWYHQWYLHPIEKQTFVLIEGVVEAWLAFGSPNKSRWPAPDRAESFKGGRALFAKVLYGAQCAVQSTWTRSRGHGVLHLNVLLTILAFLHCMQCGHILATKQTQNCPQLFVWGNHSAVLPKINNPGK